MRTVVFKNIDNEKIEFVSNLNNFILDQEVLQNYNAQKGRFGL